MKFLQVSLILFLIQEELIIENCKQVFGGCQRLQQDVKLGIAKCNACMKVAIASNVCEMVFRPINEWEQGVLNERGYVIIKNINKLLTMVY